MKLLIDIPEEVKNRLCFGITYQKDIQTVCEALNDGTPIPDNTSNGDVLSSIFNIDIKNKLVHDDITAYEITVDLGTNWTTLRINKDWWNAPYKAESEEENRRDEK